MSAHTSRRRKKTSTPSRTRHHPESLRAVTQADRDRLRPGARATACVLAAAAVSTDADIVAVSRQLRNAVSSGVLDADMVLHELIDLGALAYLSLDEEFVDDYQQVTDRVAAMAPHFHICVNVISAVMDAIYGLACLGAEPNLADPDPILDAAAALVGAHLAWVNIAGEPLEAVAHSLFTDALSEPQVLTTR